MKIKRAVNKVSSFVAKLGLVLFKAVLTSAILGMILVTVMHYMGVPVPSAADLLRGVSRLANVLS
jgi:predicted cobalt transporter CbtA